MVQGMGEAVVRIVLGCGAKQESFSDASVQSCTQCFLPSRGGCTSPAARASLHVLPGREGARLPCPLCRTCPGSAGRCASEQSPDTLNVMNCRTCPGSAG
eukprot:3499583-Rhodomonas_salina.1